MLIFLVETVLNAPIKRPNGFCLMIGFGTLIAGAVRPKGLASRPNRPYHANLAHNGKRPHWVDR
jgi:hypothetical protein